MKNKYLICGAGGFIGGHLVSSLIKEGHEVICADIKPLEFWFQLHDINKNYSLDLKEYENCLAITKDVDFIYNDKNNLNYLLFKNLQNNIFIDLVNSTEVDEDYYRSCLKNMITEKDEMFLSLYWLVILTCSSPYEIGKDSWRSNVEFGIFKMKYKAYQYHLSKINGIYNLDYKDIINKYDSKSTFFYIDPPYKGKEEYYINHDFSKETHKELAEFLNNIKGKFLLSYYYFDGIEER